MRYAGIADHIFLLCKGRAGWHDTRLCSLRIPLLNVKQHYSTRDEIRDVLANLDEYLARPRGEVRVATIPVSEMGLQHDFPQGYMGGVGIN